MRFSTHVGPLDWTPGGRDDCFPKIGFALLTELRQSVRAEAPHLYAFFPFVNDQSWLLETQSGPGWIAFMIQRNLSGANVPIIGPMKEPRSGLFRALAESENAQKELREHCTAECFSYLGPFDGELLSWRDLQGCFFDWLNSIVVPHVMQLAAMGSGQFTSAVAALSQPKRSSSEAIKASHPSDAPSQDSRYLLGEKVGEGGWAEVFVAKDTSLRRQVAVKLFHFGATHISSALDHAQALSRVSHSNIVTIYDIATLRHPTSNEETNAIIMEFLEGPTLLDLLGGSELEPSRARSISLGILVGLNELHKAGIAHTDLHGGNVKFDSFGTPKILDILYRGTMANQTKAVQDRLMRQDVLSAAKLVAEIMGHSSHQGASDFRRRAMGATSVGDIEMAMEQAFRLPIEYVSYPGPHSMIEL